MKRYLIIKIGGSEVMGQLIAKSLDSLVVFGEGKMEPRSSNLGSILMFNLVSNASIDDIMFALKDTAITNFIVTEITDTNFRAQLTPTINKGMDLNNFESNTNKMLSEMNENELNIELEYAISAQLFERCAKIKKLLDACKDNSDKHININKY